MGKSRIRNNSSLSARHTADKSARLTAGESARSVAGFTLIELLVAIALGMVILAGLFRTKDGKPFEGTDTVTIIKPKGRAMGWRFGWW